MKLSTSTACAVTLFVWLAISPVQGKMTWGIGQQAAYCCGSNAYNPLNEICCDKKIFTRPSAETKCCGKGAIKNRDPQSHAPSRSHGLQFSSSLLGSKCDSNSFNPQIQICCSGKIHQKSSELIKCCGEDAYSFTDRNVLCCNGILHKSVPEDSECVGGVIYIKENSICHLSTRPRVDKHCCGKQAFDPRKHICCNGHRHLKTRGTFCCGSEVFAHYDKFSKCCSGHVYNANTTECCGSTIFEKKKSQICCSSTSEAVIYKKKDGHRCCGHHYYNTSLWNCCAEHLKPMSLKQNDRQLKERLKPLMELIPQVCEQKVFLGKVESQTLVETHRYVLLQVLWEKHLNSTDGPWLQFHVDHCGSPVLENGMTYLWEKVNDDYKPLSLPVDLASDVPHLYGLLKCFS
ncbi:hypothetical protein DNTS_011417 [Danionella cerebrum]|uniref:Galaxin-like repeats domain-containing protein n=1 Tax=Danionella cerebrum TaxID=2873325 RepID=A0A553PVZ8_9TELE|nr:hypothetical protein DNTS_011417 [Danionella translucida]